MKKNLFAVFFSFITFSSIAQITLEKSYPDNLGLTIIKLENSGDKIVQYDIANKIVKLYNMDHSIFKTITIPAIPLGNTLAPGINYISESLFNLDSKVELLLSTQEWNTGLITYPGGSMRIINEDGATVFNGDSMLIIRQHDATNFGYYDKSTFIYNTSTGTKMVLYSYKVGDKGAKVYSLPGTLLIASVKEKGSNEILKKVYPNPSKDLVTIPYDLGNSNNATITIFDMNGKELKTLIVDKVFNSVILNVDSFITGTYIYVVKSESKYISTGKFIVSR